MGSTLNGKCPIVTGVTSGMGIAHAGHFAKPMRTALGQPGFITPFPHTVAEPICREQLIKSVNDLGQIAGWG